MGMNVMHAPEIPESVDWLNCPSSIEMETLCDKHDLVLIGFWSRADCTSWSLLEHLVALAEEFGSSIGSVAVNEPIIPGTPKCVAEHFPSWISDRLLLAEDPERELSRAYHAEATPALAIVNSEGNLVAMLSGEINRDRVRRAIEMVLEQVENLTRAGENGIQTETIKNDVIPDSIAVDSETGRVAFTDPFQNKLFVLNSRGKQHYSIGEDSPGNAVGEFSETRFRFPQGLAFHEGNLLVCDSGNHALRGIDFETESVYTIAENSEGNDFRWPVDLAVRENQFWVTLAGSDQIARVDRLEETKNTLIGSGARGTDDGGPGETTMAQPMGITNTEEVIFFVDSLSGSLRQYFPEENWGESLIQSGLFQGGDENGKGEDALLRFPTDVFYREPFLYIADQYNHVIKRYDPETDEIETWLGGEDNGSKIGEVTGLNSPAGICGTKDRLWITDSGHRRILEIDCEDWQSSEFWK